MKAKPKQPVTSDHTARKCHFLVIGNKHHIYEPVLLEALANHPDCESIWFVPIAQDDNARKFDDFLHDLLDKNLHFPDSPPEQMPSAPELTAYEISRPLKRDKEGDPPRPAEEIIQLLQNYFSNSPARPYDFKQHNVFLSGICSGLDHHAMRTLNPDAVSFCDPNNAAHADAKHTLPAFIEDSGYRASELLPKCQPIYSQEGLLDFLHTHQLSECIIKRSNSVAGHGIYRVFKDNNRWMIENPRADRSLAIEPMKDIAISPRNPYLAMESLDVSKGDMRVICAFGEVVGAFNRFPTAGSWLCNAAQGGRVEQVNWQQALSRSDRIRIEQLAKTLHQRGIPYACLDFLADASGKRYLSEINADRLTHSLNRIQEEQPDIGDKLAQKTMAYCQQKLTAPELTPAMPGLSTAACSR